MDKIAIFGVPRSGTTWLSQIYNSHPDVVLRFQPLFSYGHKGSLTERSSAADIQNFFEDILASQDPFALMKTAMQKNLPNFKKSDAPTHIVFKETRYLHIIENMLAHCGEVKIIGIVRNPLAVITSWMKASKEYKMTWGINDEWRLAPSKNQNRPEEFYGFNKWKEVAETFQRLENLYPQQFLLVNYDDLNRATLETVTELFKFCGLEVCEQVKKFLVDCKSRHDSDPYSVFRSNASDKHWQGVLPENISNQIILELKNTPLDVFLQDVSHA